MPLDSDTLGVVYTHDGELLHGAAIYDQDTFLNELLNAGGNGTVKSRDPLGRTPLHTAASHGSIKCVRLLLKRGADPNANSGIEDDCSTPVHHAAKNGHIECLAALLEYEVNLDLKDSKGRRALDVALEEGRSECLKCANYIKKVKEQRQKEIEGAKCEELYDEIDDGNYEKARLILESMDNPQVAVNRYYRGPNTLLYRASINGHVEIVQLLIDYNADGRPNADSGITPLYAAAFAGHLNVVILLSKIYPKHLIMPVTVDETYPIHAAVMKGRIEILKFLLTLRHCDNPLEFRKYSHQESSNVNIPSKTRSATTSDVHKDDMQQYYVNVNQPMKSGYTPLHLAVMYGSIEILNCLLHCKPIVNRSAGAGAVVSGALIIDPIANNMTPFHHALLLGKVEIASELLKYGVDLLEVFDDGETQSTPLQYACRSCSEEMVRMLLGHGAKDEDDAARIEAMNANKDNIVQILLGNGVFEDEEGEVVCAASQISLDLKPVIIQWQKRKLDSLKENWLLNAGISCNLHVKEKLLHDPSLRVKVFTSINLENNNLETLPIILFQMPSLKKLNVSHNKLQNLPGPSFDKSERSKMYDDLDKSSTLSENWNCPSLEELDLQHNFFAILNKNIFTLPLLKTVNASWNKIKSLPIEIWIAPSLKNLILEHNELRWLPAFSKSNSSENQEPKKEVLMKSVPDNRDGIDKNQDFATVPQAHSKRPIWNEDSDDEDEEDLEVVQKSGLYLLDLSDNQFTCLPMGLACLAPNLSRLSVRKNRITEITSISSLPEHLYSLDISANVLKLFDLSEAKDKGINICYALDKKPLQHRNMSHVILNRRTCQHCKHKQLVDLSRLILSNNQLEHLPVVTAPNEDVTKKQITLFPVLKTLDLTKNKLSKFPAGIGKLKSLCSLYIGNNPNVDSLPYELGLCSSLYELKIENLSIKDPPKNILEKRFSDIRSLTGYLKSLHDKAEVYPNIKLMIVGIHGIGKTTLLETLRKEGTGPFQQADHRAHFSERQTDKALSGKLQGNRSTVGVDVCVWYYSKGYRDIKIKFSTWDFAGQTEYYATHQCFLSRRALYLVLWKLTDGIKGIKQLERWLLNIQARAPNSTVLIVGTYLDEVDKKKKGYVEKMQTEIRQRFVSIRNGGSIVSLNEKGLPNVIGIMEVSCKNGTNIQKLRDLIYETAMNLKVDGKEGASLLLDKPIPASYIAVEKAVVTIARTLKNEMPVLDRIQFKKKVYEHLDSQGVELRNGDEELNQAVHFLHDYGTLLHYDDPSLSDLYFVDPQWLCDLLAHVVTVRSVNPCIKNGVLKISDLKNQIFKGEKRFPSSMIMKYVELMSKFEVAIKISDKFLLIPSLLPDKQRECPVVADHESPDLRTAMNIHAYLHHRVLRRQYLMNYVPSGFWARLITRLIADDRICKIVSSCYEIQGCGDFNSTQAQEDAETLMRAAPPEWACWKTGIELSCFGAKLLRVCQLENGLPFYGAADSETKVFVKNQNKSAEKTPVEILAPSLKLLIEKFIQFKPSEEGQNDDGQNLLGFRVVGVDKGSSKTAAQLLVVTIEHIDNLFAEWFPKIDQYTDIHGFKSICRVSFCDECLREAIVTQEATDETNGSSDDELVDEICRNVKLQSEGELNVYNPESKSFPKSSSNTSSVQSANLSFDDSRHGSDDATDDVFTTENGVEDEEVLDEEYEMLRKFHAEGKKCIVAFELEQGSKLLLENQPLICPIHRKVDFSESFPDLCYIDLEDNLIISPENIRQGKFLAAGAYGDVFIADIFRNDNWIAAAMKIPFNSEKGNSRSVMATMFSYDTYKNVRQELAILVPVNHVNIVSFLGVSLSPFAMLLELAPGGALDRCYLDYRNAGRKLHPCVIQKALYQISAAMKYLHRHHIIYRDLKCENVLVWSFPGPAIAHPETYRVFLKLTDYGISRSVSLSGIKGYLGTPGFMAPEIIRYTGKESYTVKVDCFSFGSLIYELIALQQPFSDVAQNKASLAQQYMLDGKRPQLRYREKRFPILILSLLYRCWAQNPEERPTMAEINGLTSLEEFPKLIDSLGLGESFNLQCVVTANQGQCKQDVVDSRNVIGSHLWFCGYYGFGDSIAARKEGVITVFSYHDSRYTHVVNIRIKDRVCMVCSVGSTVWLGTDSGLIQVFCALTFKPLALGRLICHRHILRILHSPLTHSVLITRSDGCVYAYSDNISSFPTFLPPSEMQNFFPNVTAGHSVRELFPNKEYTGDTKIHCFAAVSSHVKRKYSQEVVTYRHSSVGAIAAAVREVDDTSVDASEITSSETTYELWCGQEKGQITILDLNSLKKMKTLAVKGDDLSHPSLKDLHVTFMETSRKFESLSQEQKKHSLETNDIWLVVYPGTEVLRWDVDRRCVVSSFDASLHSPWHDLNSVKLSKKTKSMKAYDSQISSLVVVGDEMYVGTTFGCLIICDAFTMNVKISLRCYEEHMDTIIPLRMITSRYRTENEKKMVLTCGRKCLDFWIRNFNQKKRLVGKEMTILTWNTEEIPP